MSAGPQTTPPPADWAVARNLRLARRLDGLRVDTAHGRGLIREGVLRRAVGLTLEAVGCEAPLGASCKVHAEAVRIDGTLEARLRGALDAVIRQTGATA
ncbi:hypothetical protein C7E18_21525 [Stenotrophomonas maltophilia]|nr:hypothetical protein C7E18_21525 [Stenotrophomonas maltophilia]